MQSEIHGSVENEAEKEAAEAASAPECEKPADPNASLSKRQQKREKKKEKWLERKGEKRLKERAKAREKRAFARANNIDLGPSRKALKRSTMAESSCKLQVTIDLSFDDLMIDKDIAKRTKQILRCYTLNRRASAPMQFSLTSFTGKATEDMEKHNGYEHWDVKFLKECYLDIYPKDKIIYLTSESENVIEELEEDSVYVIGGLVDHNSQKGLCHKLAVEAGVRHGRLPLDKFLKMKARKVLTIDHVFEILLRVSEGKTWQEALLQVLPERKNAKLILPETDEPISSRTPDTSGDEVNGTNGLSEASVKIEGIESTLEAPIKVGGIESTLEAPIKIEGIESTLKTPVEIESISEAPIKIEKTLDDSMPE